MKRVGNIAITNRSTFTYPAFQKSSRGLCWIDWLVERFRKLRGGDLLALFLLWRFLCVKIIQSFHCVRWQISNYLSVLAIYLQRNKQYTYWKAEEIAMTAPPLIWKNSTVQWFVKNIYWKLQIKGTQSSLSMCTLCEHFPIIIPLKSNLWPYYKKDFVTQIHKNIKNRCLTKPQNRLNAKLSKWHHRWKHLAISMRLMGWTKKC